MRFLTENSIFEKHTTPLDRPNLCHMIRCGFFVTQSLSKYVSVWHAITQTTIALTCNGALLNALMWESAVAMIEDSSPELKFYVYCSFAPQQNKFSNKSIVNRSPNFLATEMENDPYPLLRLWGIVVWKSCYFGIIFFWWNKMFESSAFHQKYIVGSNNFDNQLSLSLHASKRIRIFLVKTSKESVRNCKLHVW